MTSTEQRAKEPMVPNEIDLVRIVLSAHQNAYARFHCAEKRGVIESDQMAIGYAAVELSKALAAALAARAREAELRGLRVAVGICDAFKMSEYGPHGTEWLASPHVEAVADEIREVIGNLEDALERTAGESSLDPK